MNQQFSVYDLETGRLTGAVIMSSSSDALNVVLESAVPSGCGVVLGWWDYTRHAVDLLTGEVIDIAPVEPDWRTRKASAASAAYAQIVKAESTQSRPLREVVEALLAGTDPPADAVSKLAMIKAEIDTARTRYQLILASESEIDLYQIDG